MEKVETRRLFPEHADLRLPPLGSTPNGAAAGPDANDDPSFFTDELGFTEAGRTVTFDEYLAAFREDWEPAEAKPIAVEDQQLEQERKEEEQEEQDKKELRKEQVKIQLRLMVEQDGIPTTWREYLSDIMDDLGLEVTMKTMENWTKDLRDELEQEDAEQDVDINVLAAAETLVQDEKFVFKYVPKADKRKYAKQMLQEEYGLSESAAESVVDEVVQEAVAELRYEDLINSNYYPKVEGETRDEQKQRFRERMDLEDGDDRGESADGLTGGSAADTRGVADDDRDGTPEPPGESWTCDCGAENAPDRAVCRRCTQPYEDVDNET